MRIGNTGITLAIFFAALVATFLTSWFGRQHARALESQPLSGQKLNRWLVGLSAGATANSGFVVTGAVSLGYLYGFQWLLLPLGWLLGDVLFWNVFPSRLNRLGRLSRATTLSEIITFRLNDRGARLLPRLCAIVVLVCLSGYTIAQWMAGQKFLSGAFDLHGAIASALFAGVIVTYTALGGFRGSIYTDTLQACIRIVGTLIAIVTISIFALHGGAHFSDNISRAGPNFLRPLGNLTAVGASAFVLGYAFAALGFGLGQPQLVTRYLAGSSPQETRSAWWIYIGFVQFTWIAMTVFGLLLRGVMPGIEDSESGFSLFFQQRMPAVVTGIIMADIFATLAATTNGLLIAMSQVVVRDLIPHSSRLLTQNFQIACVALGLGLATMGLSLVVRGTVVSFALTSVSLMAAGLAPAVMIRVLGWRCTSRSLVFSVVTGFAAATLWKFVGPSSFINEAAAGITSGLAVNFLFATKIKVPMAAPASEIHQGSGRDTV
jgi:Na+/proline symporter